MEDPVGKRESRRVIVTVGIMSGLGSPEIEANLNPLISVYDSDICVSPLFELLHRRYSPIGFN